MMNDVLKKFMEALRPKQVLSAYMEANNVKRHLFNGDLSKLTCHHESGEITVFHIGAKQRDASQEELLKDGRIALNGYQGKNWLYLLKNSDSIEINRDDSLPTL